MPDVRGALRPRVAAPLALVSGFLLYAAFAPVGIRPLAPVAVALLTLVLRGQRVRPALALGLVAGAAFWVPHLDWLQVAGTNAWLVLAGLETAYAGLLGIGVALATRLPGWPVWTACAWVAVEGARGRFPLGGFSWGRLAYSQEEGPFTPWAAVGGAPLVTFLVALAGGLLAYGLRAAWRSRGLFAAQRPVAAPLALAGAVAVAGSGLALPGPPGTDQRVTAALVQGNVPRLGLDAFSQRRRVTRNHLDATRSLAGLVAAGGVPRPDLVVWPENATDNDPRTDPEAAAALTEAARLAGQEILVGAVLDRPDGRLENAGIVWTPDGRLTGVYRKRHLVPYGEYVPLRSVLEPVFGRLALIPRDFAAGGEPGVLTVNGTAVSTVICFEIAYDDVVRDAVRGGGGVLVVQTNNATYGRTAQPEQQFAISRFRAVEHGRAVLVAATSGVSGVIRPDGSVVERSEEFVPALLVHEVPVIRSRTLATRAGAWPELGLSLAGLLAALIGARVRAR